MKKRTIATAVAVLFVIGGLFIALSDNSAVKFIRYAGASVVSQNPKEEEQLKQQQEQIGQEMDKAIAEEVEKQSAIEAPAEEGPAHQGGNPENEESKGAQGPSRDAIVAKYTGRLEALRGASYAQINQLLGQAKGEYLSYPAEQREEVKYKIALKYLRLARGAEKEVDARFSSIATEFEAELKRAGHDADIVGKARSRYKAEKRERMEHYLSKAM